MYNYHCCKYCSKPFQATQRTKVANLRNFPSLFLYRLAMRVQFWLLTFAALCLVGRASATVSTSSRLTHTLGEVPVSVNTATNRLVDEKGREVYFHGVNVVVKGDPWIPETNHWDYHSSFSDKDMLELQDLGLNGIRLGTMWPGAEPTRGEYNWTYINAVVNLTVKAASYGIYSLLDMHQDVLSQKFCGEGVPLWAAIPDNDTNFPAPEGSPYQLQPNGVPVGGATGAQCLQKNWPSYYVTEGCSSAFQNLYSNVQGIRDSWTNFWKTIASAVQGTGAAVMGFELLNEPWAGNLYKDIELMIPGVADKKNLQPMYDQAAAAIRTVDTTHTLFFEGVTWDWFNVGFEHVPGGQQYANLSALSYHFYVPPDFSIPIQFDARAFDIKRLGCAGFLTEFGLGACAGCGNVETVKVMDACDQYKQGWLIWEYKPFQGNRTGWSNSLWYPNGTEKTAVAKELARTYARVVAGVTESISFNATTGAFSLSFTTSASVTDGTTKIYLSERLNYPNGFDVQALSEDPAVTVTWTKPETNHIFVTYDPTTAPAGTVIAVQITRK